MSTVEQFEEREPRRLGENPLASNTLVERYNVGNLLEARGVNHSDDVSAFPRSLHNIVQAIRKMPHDEYERLAHVCKDDIPVEQLLGERPSTQLVTFVAELAALGGFTASNKKDVLRLTRTERPDDGTSSLEHVDGEQKTHYSVANTVTATVITTGNRQYVFTIAPKNNTTSLVQVGNGQSSELKNGGKITLGSRALDMRSAFRIRFNEERSLPCDLVIGFDDQGKQDNSISRSCIMVTRSNDGQIQVLEAGATYVRNIDLKEKKPDGTLVASISYSPESGRSQSGAFRIQE